MRLLSQPPRNHKCDVRLAVAQRFRAIHEQDRYHIPTWKRTDADCVLNLIR